MSRQDELLALADYHATQRALSQVHEDERQAAESLRDSLEAGDIDGAALERRRLADLAIQSQLLAQATGAPQQQQGPSPYTEAELRWLQNHPSVANDPRKMAEVVGAANSLIARGYDRNSDQYLAALDMAAGNSAHSAEAELTPDIAQREVCKSKYGPTTVDEYNRGVNELAARKAQGYYK